jgi:hypothetical protein
MDISVYISELLYDYDCVIVPGLGGFVCNYRASEIHPVQHSITPPGKSIAFNSSLKNNDGLLANYIAERKGISYDLANALINGWVNATNGLLKAGDGISIPKVGELKLNIERNIEFVPNNQYNYLKASYGLKTIYAEPVIRAKEVSLVERFENEVTETVTPRKRWKVAAVVLVFLCMAGVSQLMWSGVEIKPLNLNEASVFEMLRNIVSVEEPQLKPEPVNLPTVEEQVFEETPVEVTEQHVLETTTPEVAPVTATDGYYVIVGSFSRHKNIEATKARLLAEDANRVLLEETNGTLTKVGYLAGTDENTARLILDAARKEDSSYWLYKKR